jgi:hypothetical protein
MGVEQYRHRRWKNWRVGVWLVFAAVAWLPAIATRRLLVGGVVEFAGTVLVTAGFLMRAWSVSLDDRSAMLARSRRALRLVTAAAKGRGPHARDVAAPPAAAAPSGQSFSPMSEAVKTDIVDAVCRLLPGVEKTVAHRWLAATAGSAALAVPDVVLRLEPGLRHEPTPALPLPAARLMEIAFALSTRVDASTPPGPGSARPSSDLLHFRERADRLVREVLGVYVTKPGVTYVRQHYTGLIRQAVAGEGDEAWGGWALLAAVAAMTTHTHALPRRGGIAITSNGGRTNDREAMLAEVALQLALILLMAIGVESSRS